MLPPEPGRTPGACLGIRSSLMLRVVPAKDDLDDAAAAILRIIDAVERGELDAPPGLVARLDGATPRPSEVLARTDSSPSCYPGGGGIPQG